MSSISFIGYLQAAAVCGEMGLFVTAADKQNVCATLESDDAHLDADIVPLTGSELL